MTDPLRIAVVTPVSRKWRGKKAIVMKSTAVFLLVVFVTASLHGNWRVALLLLCASAGAWWFANLWRRYADREETLTEVDNMSDEEFVRYVRELLHVQGFSVLTLGRRHCPQADLLLSQGKENIACWMQHCGRVTDAEMVASAVAVTQAHPGWRPMVVSSRPCTFGARMRAQREGCLLIHRGGLANMVTQYRRGHKVIVFPFAEKANMRGRK